MNIVLAIRRYGLKNVRVLDAIKEANSVERGTPELEALVRHIGDLIAERDAVTRGIAHDWYEMVGLLKDCKKTLERYGSNQFVHPEYRKALVLGIEDCLAKIDAEGEEEYYAA